MQAKILLVLFVCLGIVFGQDNGEQQGPSPTASNLGMIGQGLGFGSQLAGNLNSQHAQTGLGIASNSVGAVSQHIDTIQTERQNGNNRGVAGAGLHLAADVVQGVGDSGVTSGVLGAIHPGLRMLGSLVRGSATDGDGEFNDMAVEDPLALAQADALVEEEAMTAFSEQAVAEDSFAVSDDSFSFDEANFAVEDDSSFALSDFPEEDLVDTNFDDVEDDLAFAFSDSEEEFAETNFDDVEDDLSFAVGDFPEEDFVDTNFDDEAMFALGDEYYNAVADLSSGNVDTPSSAIPSWAIALMVIGSLVVVALVIVQIQILTFFRRRLPVKQETI